MTEQVLLDTDTLSLLMRNQPAVVEKASNYLLAHRQLTLLDVVNWHEQDA